MSDYGIIKDNQVLRSQTVLVTFGDFLGSNYGLEQLIEFVQLFLLIGLLAGFISLRLGDPHTKTYRWFICLKTV